jgi:FtsH-binding integral membrane protein
LHGKYRYSLKPLSIRKSYERRESRCDCGFQSKTLLKIGGRFRKFALSGRKSIKCGSLYIAGHVLTNAEDFMNDNVQTLDYGQTISVAERNKVLRNTYLLLALSLLPTVLGAWVGVATGITAALSGMVGLVVFLVGAFGFIYAIEKTKNSAAGVPVLLAFTFFMGLMLSRMIAMVLGFKNGSDLIMTAFGGTAGVFFAMASLATVIKRDISGMGKWLTVGAVLLMVGAGGRMVKERAWLAVPAVFETERVTVALPAAAGVPVIAPLVALRVRPAGRFAAPNDLGRLSAVMRWLKGVPTRAVAVEALVICGSLDAKVMVSVWLPPPPAFVA